MARGVIGGPFASQWVFEIFFVIRVAGGEGSAIKCGKWFSVVGCVGLFLQGVSTRVGRFAGALYGLFPDWVNDEELLDDDTFYSVGTIFIVPG